ncbi:protein kinase [Roseibium salinum]|nr:protein kinase [Roseibium salinum]
MEFVSGPSLSQRLEAGPLEPEAVYRLLQRVASALQAVHDREVIHRDLSPDNIILQNDDVGQAKIIDFGIARANTGGPTIIGDGFCRQDQLRLSGTGRHFSTERSLPAAISIRSAW